VRVGTDRIRVLTFWHDPRGSFRRAQPVAVAEPVGLTDQPYIEPACCSTHKINDRMFFDNENRQAMIADLAAGTCRQLVEAAESDDLK
jgi:hypothetical protein